MTDQLIFFVDDEPMFINLLEYTFNCRNGYVTRAFNNAEDCLEHLYMKPKLIVVDFFLQTYQSKMTGLDLVKAVKKNSPDILLVILSGHDEDNIIEMCKAAGVDKYIVKDGYFIDNLIECVSKMLPVES